MPSETDSEQRLDKYPSLPPSARVVRASGQVGVADAVETSAEFLCFLNQLREAEQKQAMDDINDRVLL